MQRELMVEIQSNKWWVPKYSYDTGKLFQLFWSKHKISKGQCRNVRAWIVPILKKQMHR